MSDITIKYQTIGRASVRDASGMERHAIKLLYRGDGSPWWIATAALELQIPAESDIQPGDHVYVTISKSCKNES